MENFLIQLLFSNKGRKPSKNFNKRFFREIMRQGIRPGWLPLPKFIPKEKMKRSFYAEEQTKS